MLAHIWLQVPAEEAYRAANSSIHPNSAVQPAYETIAVVSDILEALEQHKKTDAYKKAVNNSKDRWGQSKSRTGQNVA